MRGLIASPLGLVVGLVLGTLGSGGSILAVPALVYAIGLVLLAVYTAGRAAAALW